MHRPSHVHLVPPSWRKDARAQRRAARDQVSEADQAVATYRTWKGGQTGQPAAPAEELAGVLRLCQGAAQWLLGLIVIGASAAAFSESYRALILWATGHRLGGDWGVIFPAQVDTFILAGELAVFVAICRRWAYRSRRAAWLVTLGGLAASVAWNVGHVSGGDWQSRATASVPPLAAAVALAIGLGILKRVINGDEQADAGAQPVVAALPEPAAPVAPEALAATVAEAVAAAVSVPLGELRGTLGDLAARVAALSVPVPAPKPERPPARPRPQRPAKDSGQPKRERAVVPAAEAQLGDPPVAAIQSAASARELAALSHITRYRAQQLMAPGSYAHAGHVNGRHPGGDE